MRYEPIKLSRLDPPDRQRIYGASRITLCQDTAGAPGRDYIYGERGIDVDTVAKFRLGFVPFSAYARPESWFAGRIVFPIFDFCGDLLALSVRPVINDPDLEQKYWNEAFSKQDHLFGFDQAKYDIAKTNCAVVVEGQIDVIQMHSHGITNTVGIMGGAFTPLHAMLLTRFAENVIFIMDGDTAGGRHAEKAREVTEIYAYVKSGKRLQKRSRLNAGYISLDRNEDPDSLLRKGGSTYLREKILEVIEIQKMRVKKSWLQR